MAAADGRAPGDSVRTSEPSRKPVGELTANRPDNAAADRLVSSPAVGRTSRTLVPTPESDVGLATDSAASCGRTRLSVVFVDVSGPVDTGTVYVGSSTRTSLVSDWVGAGTSVV